MQSPSGLAFLLSNWYSGATLFSLLLTNHPRVTCNAETFPHNFDDLELYTCSCGQSFPTCGFYRTTCTHMLSGDGYTWDPRLLAILPTFSGIPIVDKWLKSFNHLHRLRDAFIANVPSIRKRVDEFVRVHSAFYDSCRDLDGSHIYVDGTKSLRRAELFAQDPSNPPKLVFLVRDARGYCNSYLKNRRLPVSQLSCAANSWLDHIRMVDGLLHRHTDAPCLTVRYEDLCRNLEDTMNSVFGFLGVASLGAFRFRHGLPHHVLGNRMRKGFDGKIQEDLSWKTRFSAEEVVLIEGITQKGLERFGYV